MAWVAEVSLLGRIHSEPYGDCLKQLRWLLGNPSTGCLCRLSWLRPACVRAKALHFSASFCLSCGRFGILLVLCVVVKLMGSSCAHVIAASRRPFFRWTHYRWHSSFFLAASQYASRGLSHETGLAFSLAVMHC